MFVPAAPSRMDKFLTKALGSVTDSIVIDLEDSVAEVDKEAARAKVGAWLASSPNVGGKEIVVRINGAAAVEDVGALLGDGGRWPDALMVPKVASAACLELVDAHCSAHRHARFRTSFVATSRPRSVHATPLTYAPQ